MSEETEPAAKEKDYFINDKKDLYYMKYVFCNKLKSIYNKNNQITNVKDILNKQTERPLLN